MCCRTAKEATGAAVVLITHDLGVVAGFADRVAVMYAGRIVEIGDVDDVFYRPRMPYTLGLLGSIPRLDLGRRQRLTPIEGNPPSLVHLPSGCPFWPRCPLRIQKCVDVEPALLPIQGHDASHRAACHRSDEIEQRQTDEHRHLSRAAGSRPQADAVARETRPTVLEVRDLVKHYPLLKGGMLRRRVGTVHAVDGISFDIRERETLGLVGESGCGKTTAIMEILNLVKPQAGTIVVLGRDTATLTPAERFAIRRDLQVVFQDPLASLDPRLPIGDILAEPLETHGVPPADRARRVRELLTLVGLQPEHANRYPQAFSGGQRQRIGIARALALEPKVLVLDEPVSALDVSIRAGIINLLEELQAALGLSYLFVAHDLSVVRHHRRSRGRDVPGPDCGNRRRGRGVRAAGAPVHPGAALGDSAAGSAEGAAAAADRAAGRPAEPGRSAVGLPVPHALPEVRGRADGRAADALHRAAAAAAAADRRPGPPRRVPLRARRFGIVMNGLLCRGRLSRPWRHS